jgi:hypothetical protein
VMKTVGLLPGYAPGHGTEGRHHRSEPLTSQSEGITSATLKLTPTNAFRA